MPTVFLGELFNSTYEAIQAIRTGSCFFTDFGYFSENSRSFSSDTSIILFIDSAVFTIVISSRELLMPLLKCKQI